MNLVRILFLFIFGIGILSVYYFYSPVQYKDTKKLVVVPGEGVKQIGGALEDLGVIRSQWWFEAYVYMQGDGGNLKAGEYSFPSMNLFQVIRRLVDGEPREHITLTFIEGWTLEQMADYVDEESHLGRGDFLDAAGARTLDTLWRSEFSFLEDVPSGHTLEGFLFPDTYRFFDDVSAEDVVRKLLETFDRKVSQGLRDRVLVPDMNFFELVTLASIIEREVRSVDDMKKVSGVFANRLDVGMRLQADSTVNYAIGGDRSSLTTEQTKIDTPYNTYLYAGLPPGPISNPGLRALEAAADPEEHDFLYFLSKLDGETVFSVSLEEHNIAKAKYLK